MVRLWVGEAFVYSPALYAVLGPSAGFAMLAGYFCVVLVGLERQRALAAIYLAAGVSFIPLAWMLMSVFGVLGLAAAMAAVNLAVAAAGGFLCLRSMARRYEA